jgi:hypothetical protein
MIIIRDFFFLFAFQLSLNSHCYTFYNILCSFFNAGTVDRTPTDCRTEGCGKNAECIREGAVFVCRCLPGTTGRAEVECHSGRTRNT